MTYEDGHAHCFSPGCDYWKAADGSEPAEGDKKERISDELLDPYKNPGAFDALDKRKLKTDTLKKYGVFSAGYSGQKVQVYPYHNQEGELAAQKLRWPNKDFTALKNRETYPGKLNACRLFGHHVYGDRFDRQVIITEGELDALSIAQSIEFKTAVVSVPTGAEGAAKALKANYLWLDRFKEIILWLDDDEPGRVATEECAKLFAVGKVRVAKVPGMKDASDVLQANKPGDIQTAIYAATAWRPQGIVNAADCKDDIRAPREKVLRYEYPAIMPKLQEMSGGIRLGELTFHVAGTGVGKSTQIREIIYDLAMRQGLKVGSMWFEDTRRDAQLLLMSIAADERLQLITEPDPTDPNFDKLAEAYDGKMIPWHDKVFGSRKFELFDAQTAEWTLEAIVGYVRYMARALDCLVIVIDPLSFIIQLMDQGMDERRAIDLVAATLAKSAKELGVAIHCTHHLKRLLGIPHEEGAPTSANDLRGSGGLANAASLVVGWERNSQAAEDGWRVTQARILKPHRMVGLSGLADILYYQPNGRLVKSPIPFPPVGKPKGEGDDQQHSRGGGFPPAGPGDY